MANSELTESQRSALQELEFTNPVADSLTEWDQARQNWNSKLRFLFHAATARDVINVEEQKLLDATDTYEQAFVAAATTVAGEFIEEQAVVTLHTLLTQDDKQRRQAMYSWYDLSSIPKPSVDHLHDIATSYGDPKGKLRPIGVEDTSLIHASAQMAYAYGLNHQSDYVLSGVRHANREKRRQSDQARSRKIGRRAFGRYQRGES